MKQTKKAPDLDEVLQVLSQPLPKLTLPIQHLLVNLLPKFCIYGGLLIASLTLYFLILDPQTQGMDQLTRLNYYMRLLFNFVLAGLLWASEKPLKARSLRGWRMLYYVTLIHLLLFIMTGNIPGLISLIIIFYILSQIRHNYT